VLPEPHALFGMRCGILQGGHARSVNDLPLVRQPLGQLADGQGRKVDQQLREIELWIHVMPAAAARRAGQDGGCSSTTRVVHEE